MVPSLETRLSVPPSLSIADLGGESVVLDPASGEYFGLNEVAARILELAGEQATIGHVVDCLLDEFEVDRDRLTADVRSFVVDLQNRGLVLLTNPTS